MVVACALGFRDLHSIALVFSVVSILRYGWVFWTAAAGRDAPEAGIDSVVRKDLTE